MQKKLQQIFLDRKRPQKFIHFRADSLPLEPLAKDLADGLASTEKLSDPGKHSFESLKLSLETWMTELGAPFLWLEHAVKVWVR